MLANSIFIYNIGKGISGTVKKFKQPDNSFIAVKTIINHNTNSSINEIYILQILKGCSNVLQISNVDIVLTTENITTNIITPCHDTTLENIYDTLTYKCGEEYYPVIMNQLLTALKYLHDYSIIHRDIKPSNILVDNHRDGLKCYLADFGISCKFDTLVDIENNVYTYMYRPPEVVCGNKYDYKADIWALGVSMLEFLTKKILITCDDSLELIIRNMLNLLIVPLEYTDENIKLLKNMDIYDHIDIKPFLRRCISENFLIHEYNKLTGMLAINPKNRLSITELINISDNISSSIPILQSNNILDNHVVQSKDNVNSNRHYSNICKIINVYDILHNYNDDSDVDITNEFFDYNINILIVAIDIFKRYILGNSITNEELNVLVVSCLIISEKIVKCDNTTNVKDYIDVYMYDVNEYDLALMEISIIKRINYLIISKEAEIEIKMMSTIDNAFDVIADKYGYNKID